MPAAPRRTAMRRIEMRRGGDLLAGDSQSRSENMLDIFGKISIL